MRGTRFAIPGKHRSALAAVALTAAGLAPVLAACGGSSPATPPASTAATPGGAASASSAPASGAAALAAVKTAWLAFFNAKTPVPRRVALLQNGQAFASIIRAQASSPLASSATAQVSKVTLVSATQAKVTYSILVSGAPALSGQSGVAVYQHGRWKVGDASFCGLLALENGGKTSSLPAACPAGG